MKINRAIGLAIGLIIIQLLASGMFHAFEKTVLVFFDTAQMFLKLGQVATTAAPFH